MRGLQGGRRGLAGCLGGTRGAAGGYRRAHCAILAAVAEGMAPEEGLSLSPPKPESQVACSHEARGP